MKDKSLSIFLIVLFGMSGIAILLLTWLRPMPESERILEIGKNPGHFYRLGGALRSAGKHTAA